MPKSDAGASGYRKGFLLSPSNKKSSQTRRKNLENKSITPSIQPVARPAPASSKSSALMDVEEREITETKVVSLFHLDDPSFSEIQPKKTSGLIMSRPIIQSVSGDKEDPIPTAPPIHLGDDSDALDIGLREVTTGRMQHAGESTVSTHRTSALSVEQADDSSSQSLLSLTHMSLLDKEFARALWSLRNVPSPVQVCQQFMESHLVTSSHWRCAWKLVFQELVGEESSCAVELGYEMMIAHGMSLPASFLVLAEDKTSRVSALGAATFFARVARKQRFDANDKILLEMLTVVYLNLVRMASHSSTTRSRLSQQAVAAAITIMAVSSEITGVESAFVQGLPDLDRLLAIQQQWTELSIATTENSVQVARKQCTLAVFSDWRAALNHSRVNEFKGTQLGFGRVNFGGLCQTLCSETGTMTVQEICAIISENNNHAISRDIYRGLAAWLGDNKKSLKQFKLAQESYLLVEYLITNIWDGGVELTITILNYIWSESNGLPPKDVSGTTFRLLLDVVLKRNTSNIESDGDDGSIAVCTLLAKLLLEGGPSRLNDFVTLAGDEPIVAEVLICVVVNAGDSELVTDAAGVLISNVGNSPSLRHKMKTMPNLFQHVSCEFLVHRLIHVACTVINEASTTSNATIDTLSTLMSQRLQQCFASRNLGHFIESVVKTLLAIENSSEMVSAELGKVFAPSWRQVVMLESVTDHRGFCLVLDALALAVLSSPSSLALLTLLGAFVGEPADYLLESTRTLRFIQLGMQNVVQLCTEHLKAAHTLELTCDVFERLSPLLLLRRIPSRLYRVAWERSFSDECTDKKETTSLLSSLASEIAARLSFDESSPKGEMISPYERRLAAEVAGHCLPFDMGEAYSCFHRICQPAFQKALDGACSASTISVSFKPAKAALHAVVYYMSLSVDPESSDGIFATLAFALRICGMPEPLLSEDQDLEQLRTLGCAELFSSCFEQTFAYDKSTLLNVTTLLRQILTDESPDLGRAEQMATRMFHVDGKVVLSPKLRSALWNSLLEVSKRCPDGKLEKWETSILPWVIPRALDGKNHPLCVAIGLQVVFVLIVRSKSLDCVQRRGGGVKRLYQWALRSMEYPPHSDHFAVTLVKTVGLKLLVAMLTMDQIGGVRYFGAREVMQTMEILESAVVSNEEPEVQQVAVQMLTSLKIR